MRLLRKAFWFRRYVVDLTEDTDRIGFNLEKDLNVFFGIIQSLMFIQ